MNKLYLLLALLIFRSGLICAQEHEYVNLTFQNGKFFFSIDENFWNQSPEMFYDAEYGVPAFSFFISGNLKNLQLLPLEFSNKKNTFPLVPVGDLVKDGTLESEQKIVDFKPTKNDFPLISVKSVDGYSNHYAIIIRPWKLVSDQTFQLIKTAEITVQGPLEKIRMVSDVEFLKPIEKSSPFKSLNSAQINSSKVLNGFRIKTRNSGIHRINFSEIFSEDENSNLKNAPSSSIMLMNKGAEIPILLNDGGDGKIDEGDYFEFWAEKHLVNYQNPKGDMYYDPYSLENVYYLTRDENSIGSTARLGIISGEIRERIFPGDPRNLFGESFRHKIHFENNLVYELMGNVDTTKTSDTRDHSFWSKVLLNERKSFNTRIPYPDRNTFNPATIKLALHGLTFVAKQGFQFEHNIKVDIGSPSRALALSNPIGGTEKWDGQSLNILSYTIDGNTFGDYMSTSNSQVQIQNYDPSSPNVATGRQFALNWIEIDYNRLYLAENNVIEFRLPENKTQNLYQFVLENFTNPDIQIYKKGVGKILNITIESYTKDAVTKERAYRVIFQDYIINPKSTEYIALNEDAKQKPIKIEKVFPSVVNDTSNPFLKSTDREESFIIITSNKFWNQTFYQSGFSSVKDYADYREGVLKSRETSTTYLNGRSKQVLITTVEDIFDEFNHGIVSPHAIRNFLSFAYHQWKRPPKFVLLLGDARQDFYTENNFVPTQLIQTVLYGAAASDGWYGMVSGDDIIPDIHISRVPANNVSDIATYLNKLKSYENDQTFDGWRNNSLFIAGFENFFIVDNDTVRNSIDKSYFTDVLHIKAQSETDPFFGGKSQLLNYWNNGQVTINFMGHGGGGIWADRGLMDLPDVNTLNPSSKLPFVSSMTCFTGAFTQNSLLERLIIANERGAISAFGSSGVGWRWNDRFLGESLYRYLLKKEFVNLTIGEIVDLGRFIYRVRYSDYFTFPYRIPNSMIHQYNLFGDPAIILNYPDKTVDPIDKIQLVGSVDSVSLKINSDKITTGTVTIQFSDSVNRQPFIPSLVLPFTNGVFEKNIAIPQQLKGSSGHLKYYVTDQVTDQAGYLSFYYGDFVVNEVISDPLVVEENLPFKFKVKIDSRNTITFATLRYDVIEQISANNESVKIAKIVNLQSIGDGWWEMEEEIPAIYSNLIYQFRYSITLKDQFQNEYLHRGTFFIEEQPDVSAAKQIKGSAQEYYDNLTIGIYDHNGPKLGAEIYNNSDLDIEKVIIRFYSGGIVNTNPPYFTGTQLLLGETTESIEKNSTKMIFIPIPLDFVPGQNYAIGVHAFVDPALGVKERSVSNNLSKTTPVEFRVYSVMPAENKTITYGGVSLTFNQAVDQQTYFTISEHKNSIIDNQPGLSPVSIQSIGSSGFEIKSYGNGTSNTLTMPIIVESKIANLTVSELKNSSLYKFNEKTRKWIKLTSSEFDTIGMKITAQVKTFGKYRVFKSSDFSPPKTDISVEGRTMNASLIIPPQANFTFVVQDENGVINNKEDIVITFNGVDLLASQLNIADSLSDGNLMVVTFQKQLPVGNNTLSYSFKDANQNVYTSSQINFQVSSTSDFIFYGGYPNPFEKYQLFTFEVQGQAKSVELKIFTVSGRLINSYKSNETPNQAFIPDVGLQVQTLNSLSNIFGYNEIFWNGKDRYGDDVAYGVYYAKLIIHYPNKSIEKIFKSVRAGR